MKANEFVKKFGWSSLKIAIRLPQFCRYKYVIFYSDEIDFKNEFDEHHKDYMFETGEIKQLIEAKELVEFIGNDLSGAKQVYEFTKKSVNIALSDRVVPVESLKKAIQLVESCQ